MGVGIFFNKDVIKRDMNRFAEAIPQYIDGCTQVEATQYNFVDGSVGFGYLAIVKDYGLFQISMPYEANDAGEYAVKDEVWSVANTDLDLVKTGFKTLGDVTDYINNFTGISSTGKEKELFDKEKEIESLVEILAQSRLLLAQSEDEKIFKLAKDIKLNTESCIASLGLSVSNLKGKSIQRYLELNEELKKENGQ